MSFAGVSEVVDVSLEDSPHVAAAPTVTGTTRKRAASPGRTASSATALIGRVHSSLAAAVDQGTFSAREKYPLTKKSKASMDPPVRPVEHKTSVSGHSGLTGGNGVGRGEAVKHLR